MRTLFGEDIVKRMGAFLKANPSVDWTTRQLFSGLEGYPKDVESTGFRIADELNNDGWDLHRTGHYREAITIYDKALFACPEFPTVWNNKGLAHFRLG